MTIPDADIFRSTAKIVRPGTTEAEPFGVVSRYQGTQPAGEVEIASGLQCSIQEFMRVSRTPESNLPGGAGRHGQWRIFFPPGVADDVDIRRDDVCVDEANGRRFIIAATYPSFMGVQLQCNLLIV